MVSSRYLRIYFKYMALTYYLKKHKVDIFPVVIHIFHVYIGI